MALFVVLHAYSQRPDPRWFLTDDQELELGRRVQALRDRSPVKARGGLPIFGYRGWSVSSSPGASSTLIISQGIIDPGPFEASLIDPDRTIESFLLETGGNQVEEALREEVAAAFFHSADEMLKERTENLAGAERVAVGYSKAKDAPAYAPDLWNSSNEVKGSNNCYNYANHRLLNKAAVPGRAHGIFITYASCCGSRSPEDGATADGLTKVSDFSSALEKGEGWYVALKLSEKHDDCHWFRQDCNGYWSYKLGEDIASNIDADGLPITDPRHCNSGKYSIFCSYMITDSGVTIA